MAVFSTSDAQVLLPRTIADGMITKTRSTSVVAQLSGQEPQKFGKIDYIVFNDFPKMEFVGENQNKGHTTGGFTSVTAEPRKGHVTMRFSDEVQWADEDHQLGILTELANAGAIAQSRGLDLGLLHRINPLTGDEMSWNNYLMSTSNIVDWDGEEDADLTLRDAVGVLIENEEQVNGVALDPKFSWALSSLQSLSGGVETGTPRYPNLGFGTNITDFMGLNAAQGNTVSGVPEADDTGVRAIVGDFQNGIRWGVQREVPIEIIRNGDPDGQGDLRRKNQLALRMEIVYGWYVFAEKFAAIKVDTEG